MKKWWLRILTGLALLAPLSAHALVPAGELNTICAANSPVCSGYTLGGAERYWLVNVSHKNCNAGKDMKVSDALMDAVSGEGNLYSVVEPNSPAAHALLSALLDQGWKQCMLGLKFSTLLEKCRSKLTEENMACEAYISGTLDMTQTLHAVKQVNAKKTENAPFCEAGAAKEKFSVEELKAALVAWGATDAKKLMENPAAQEVVNALLFKYPCAPNNTQKK